MAEIAPLAVVAGPCLNLDMSALANSFDTTAERINVRLRKIVKHKPVEKPE